MKLLAAAFEPARRPAPHPPWGPILQATLAALLLVAAGLALEAVSGAHGALGRGAASGAVHAGLVAVGWVLAAGDEPGWRASSVVLGTVLIGASVAARLSPWGAALFLLPPPLLVRQSRRSPALRAVGVAPAAPRAVALGLGAGAFLGLHLLLSAARTLGYGLGVSSPAAYLAALAYDAGANALSAEWLFRGALFSWAWRRWAFWPAAGASTALCLVRYLLDPALPRTIEVAAGTVFYVGCLGVACCGLRAWTGSLLPGYLATLVFFAAYRLLQP